MVAICVAVPLMESIDTWDARDGHEIEIHVVVATFCVGFALAATRRLLATPLKELPAIHQNVQASEPLPDWAPPCFTLSPPPTDSPPLPLRV